MFEATTQQLGIRHLLNASKEQVAINEATEALPPKTLTDSKIMINSIKIIDGGMRGLDKIHAHPIATQHRVELLKIRSMVKNQTRFFFKIDMNGLLMFERRRNIAILGMSG